MEVKLIRALRDIHVPHNPEQPQGNSLKAVQGGLLTLIPKDYKLPQDAYLDLGDLKSRIKKPKED